MIHTFKCIFGVPCELRLDDRFGARVEIEALEFMGNAPVDWRIEPEGWRKGLHDGHPALRGFHDMQRPALGGTVGTPVANAVLETRGIGDCIVMVWLREGTYSERKHSSELMQVLQPSAADLGCA